MILPDMFFTSYLFNWYRIEILNSSHLSFLLFFISPSFSEYFQNFQQQSIMQLCSLRKKQLFCTFFSPLPALPHFHCSEVVNLTRAFEVFSVPSCMMKCSIIEENIPCNFYPLVLLPLPKSHCFLKSLCLLRTLCDISRFNICYNFFMLCFTF